jgi:hypothetical protein
MYNQVTDRFGFVRTEIVQALPLLGRTISSKDGYSLEVFRSGEHFASVRPRTVVPASTTRQRPVQKPQRMKAANGDVVYWVSVVPQPIPIVGSFTTLDNFVRIYDLTLDLVVSYPELFAKGYRQGKDPVNLAIESFKTEFFDYATKTEHDKLKVLKQPGSVWNNSLSADTGMKIAQISQSSFRDDPQRLEIAKLQQDAEKDKLAIEIKAKNQNLEDQFERIRDSEKRMHERYELVRQREFEHEEQVLQHSHERGELEKQKVFEREERTRHRMYERRELEKQREFERQELEKQLIDEIRKQEKQKAFEREEKTRQHIYDLHYQLRVAAAQELKEILRERIRDTFDRGKPIDDVAEESLKLLNAFHESLHRSYVDSTLANGHSSSTNDTSSGEDTSFERDLNTDPSIFSPPNLKDLSGTEQKKDQRLPLRSHRHPPGSTPRRLRRPGRQA